jgi:hypothetical protein
MLNLLFKRTENFTTYYVSENKVYHLMQYKGLERSFWLDPATSGFST